MRCRSLLKALGLFFLGVLVLSGCALPCKSAAKEAKDLPEQEDIHYELVTGIVLEALGTKPPRIISKEANRHPWAPEKTIFLSQSREPMDPMEFITAYKGKPSHCTWTRKGQWCSCDVLTCKKAQVEPDLKI